MPPQTGAFGAFDLSGKKAMVVGAEFAPGAAIARAFAQAGADVALCALTADEAVMRARAVKRVIEAMGRGATEYVMDVTLGKNVQVTTRQVAKEMGGLDIVASAPGLFLAKPIEETGDTELARVMQVNFASQFFIVRTAAGEFRRARRAGRILLVTSAFGEHTMPHTTAYASAHGAVHSLVRSAAEELAPDGIAVNAISVGSPAWADGGVEVPGADAIGATAVELCAPRAPASLTGRIIPVDGGALPHR